VLEVVKYCDLPCAALECRRPSEAGSIGKDWLKSFLRRHSKAGVIHQDEVKLKRKRWSVSWEAAISTCDIPAECKLRSPTLHPGKPMNTDETSFTPDKRAKRVIIARGEK